MQTLNEPILVYPKRELNFSITLVPSVNPEAPIYRLTNGVLVANQNSSSRWKVQDVFILSDRPLNECKWVLTPDLKVITSQENTSKYSMAIEASSDETVPVPGVPHSFIEFYIKASNNNRLPEIKINQELKGICCSPLHGLSHQGYCEECDGYKEGYFNRTYFVDKKFFVEINILKK